MNHDEIQECVDVCELIKKGVLTPYQLRLWVKMKIEEAQEEQVAKPPEE